MDVLFRSSRSHITLTRFLPRLKPMGFRAVTAVSASNSASRRRPAVVQTGGRVGTTGGQTFEAVRPHRPGADSRTGGRASCRQWSGGVLDAFVPSSGCRDGGQFDRRPDDPVPRALMGVRIWMHSMAPAYGWLHVSV